MDQQRLLFADGNGTGGDVGVGEVLVRADAGADGLPEVKGEAGGADEVKATISLTADLARTEMWQPAADCWRAWRRAEDGRRSTWI
ncbi:hypothetical protein RHGRI_028656 [Rhododendron griersonianum]|uniref:Uncharacterized protein n=1 Tax=Rhododendron griersonianum TaxID=479676 RepID=A0AAV6IKD5_9ERIC|nr:hypothetical protein RHGRI_028656 [Rhododendron griersonianum]